MSSLKTQSSKIFSALITITVIQEEAQVWLQDECKYQFSSTALTETLVLFSLCFLYPLYLIRMQGKKCSDVHIIKTKSLEHATNHKMWFLAWFIIKRAFLFVLLKSCFLRKRGEDPMRKWSLFIGNCSHCQFNQLWCFISNDLTRADNAYRSPLPYNHCTLLLLCGVLSIVHWVLCNIANRKLQAQA